MKSSSNSTNNNSTGSDDINIRQLKHLGTRESFKVKVRLHQRSVLSPCLFAVIMDRLTDEVKREPPWTMQFADDIVICEETREKLERRLEYWRYALKRRRMKVNRSKTEYLCVNEGSDEEAVKMEDTKVPRVKESPLPTAKLIHRKRKAKQATHKDGSWFKTVITVSEHSIEKTKISLL